MRWGWYEIFSLQLLNICFFFYWLTCDGVKNKYVWLEPCITLCNGFTCWCPSKRKWADSKFVHGLFATWKLKKKKKLSNNWLNKMFFFCFALKYNCTQSKDYKWYMWIINLLRQLCGCCGFLLPLHYAIMLL